MQTCPERWKAAVTAPAAATSSGALSQTIIGSLPPASITAGFIAAAAAMPTALPAATEPVKATAWVLGEAMSASASAAPPGRQATRPAGSPRKHFMNSSVESVVAGAGFTMQPLPAASEAATVQHMRRTGKLNGMIWTETPRGA